MLRFFAFWQTYNIVFMAKLREDIEQNLPFISVINYGGEEYIGIIINQDQFVTSFYDLNAIKTPEEKQAFLEVGETWWWESNRQFPISIFCKEQIHPFAYAIKTFNSKDVRVILGPVVNLMNLTLKRVKRKSVQLVRRTR
jgi:hypothetical protein